MRENIIEALQQKVITWVETRPDIRAVVIVGSRARRDHPADEWSDLDLVLFVEKTSLYTSPDGWLETFGEYWVSVPFVWNDDYPEHLVLYEDGVKLDFGFHPLSNLHDLIGMAELPDTFGRGYTILVDKDGLAAQIQPPPFRSPSFVKPSMEEFTRCIQQFWYTASQIAKNLRRGDLWTVKVRDAVLKEELLRMVEWNALAANGWQHDVWHSGRFMREWVDPQTWDDLHGVFAHFDAADSWRALFASLDLFRRLTTEIAQISGYRYPDLLDERITGYVNQQRAEAGE